MPPIKYRLPPKFRDLCYQLRTQTQKFRLLNFPQSFCFDFLPVTLPPQIVPLISGLIEKNAQQLKGQCVVTSGDIFPTARSPSICGEKIPNKSCHTLIFGSLSREKSVGSEQHFNLELEGLRNQVTLNGWKNYIEFYGLLNFCVKPTSKRRV